VDEKTVTQQNGHQRWIEMSALSDRVWSRLDKIAAPVFPPKIRRFLTFKSMTVIVLLLFIWNLSFKLFMPPFKSPAYIPLGFIEYWARSPLFLIPYDVGLLAVLVFVFATRPRGEYGYLRALLYGAVVAALLEQCVSLFVPGKG
jgi:hypothetical protein